jgi:hypothetical protein
VADVGRTSPGSSATRFALVALLATLICELMGTSSARGATPCWQTVVTDWSDGHIDGTYPIGCYRQALHSLPEDIRLYSSATDDITRALARRVRATSRRVAGGIVTTGSASPSTVAAAGSGAPLDSTEPSVLLAGSLAILVALLAGGVLVARRKLPSHRLR